MKYSDTFYENLLLEDYSTILAFTLDTNELVGVATARISDELVYDRSVMGCGGEVEGYIMTLGVYVTFECYQSLLGYIAKWRKWHPK